MNYSRRKNCSFDDAQRGTCFSLVGNSFTMLFTSNRFDPRRLETVTQKGIGVELPDLVDVVGCTVLPCSIIRGEDVVMYMNFTANQFVDTLKVKAIAKVFEQEIDYPFLPEKDGCKALTNNECPLEINEPAQYKLVMLIPRVFPKISTTITLYLEGNEIPGNKVACFEIEANVI
ncbi:hypothetical protein FQA39_LY10954 [Lamprigera yunnana]|nr:hypothetical protein FQA39_LY10954 [Lamprigera yunnana]